MKNIQIGTVKMPLSDFVVSRNAILGITKSGKTYTAKGVAEQLLEHDIPIIVFDAIGVWRYLKTPGDGANAIGYKVVVAGGEHPDLPLTPKSAPEIVRAAIKENIPLIIDLYDSKLSKADWRRIVQSCFRILLYENKGLRHVFLEESAEFAPQKVMDGETYAEVEKLARMGGNKGVGITFINQRAQELNKAVLELCDNVVLLRQRGSHAIDSLEKWLDRLAPDTAKEIANSMPHMTQGDCWIFTENAEVPIRTRSGLIRSLHPDRRMPEQALSGRKVVDADIFVKRLTTELPKLAEEQKENDPVALKKRILELERQLKSAPVAKSSEPEEVSVLMPGDRARIDRFIVSIGSLNNKLDTVKIAAESLTKEIPFFKAMLAPLNKEARPQVSQVPTVRRVTSSEGSASYSQGGPLGKCERAILTALAQYPQGRTKNQISILSGYSSTSSGYDNALSKLRSLEYITRGNPVVITDLGLAALGTWNPLPTGESLQSHWVHRLGKCESTILSALLRVHPGTLTKEEVAEQTGYSTSSSGFDNALSKLRTLELITRGQPIKASDDFFQ
jgi:hypothetical protein